MELILHFSVHYANIRVFCETTKFWEEFLLHAQAVTVAIFINVRKTPLSDCLPIFFRLPCPPLAKRGSLTHSQALALSKRARDVTSMLLRRFFPTTPSLLHKEGSTAFPKPFFSLRRLAALGIVQASLALHSFAQPFPSGDKGCNRSSCRS